MTDNENNNMSEEEIDLSESENKQISDEYEKTRQEKATEKKEKVPFIVDLYDWLETFGLALSVMVLIFLFIFKYVTVDGTSMLETLQNGDKLIITSLAEYDQGDIIVVRQPTSTKPLVKRIIAKGGQTVEIDFDTWSVYIDGEKLDEEYVRRVNGAPMRKDSYDNYAKKGKIVVPEGQIFVMGDNRNGSSDSRRFGCIDEKNIIGEVVFRILPISEFGAIRNNR